MYATAPLKIRAFFPFSFREKVDPRNIFSVGEQVMAEHLFSFHAKSSTQGYSLSRGVTEVVWILTNCASPSKAA
jgi:hypothetical protein